MTLPFKKNKLQSILYSNLEIALQNARDNNKNFFYFPLNKEEEKNAQSWAISHNFLMEVSHKNGDTLIYKFTKIKE